MLRLHDTATGTVRPLELRNEGEVSMYVCGPTVYDMPHIGHGRANLTFDILRRYLIFIGLEVHYVANVTDVDDNIIKRAAELGRTERRRGRRVRGPLVGVDGRAGGSCGPQDIPHATHYVEDMVALVGELMAKGKAYETPDGVYLEVAQVHGVRPPGPQQSLESLRSGPGSRRTRTSARPWTSPCGRRPRRASPAGTHRGGRVGPGGTPSAWSCRSTSWARGSTCTAAGRT